MREDNLSIVCKWVLLQIKQKMIDIGEVFQRRNLNRCPMNLHIIKSNNLTKTMIWNYILAPGVFCPPMFQTIVLPATSFSQKDPGTSFSPTSSGEVVQKQKLFLNITAEDLLNEGYDTNKTAWSEEEDRELQRLRDQQNLQWTQIAEYMPGRNSKMCYSRYRRLENNTKQIWRKADDDLLLELVEKCGADWKEISKYFPKRTHKQIKQHYINYLKPGIRRDDWTLEEDLKLVELLNRFGKNWKRIESNFDGRTQNQIKNRFFGRLKRLADRSSGRRRD